MTRHGHNTKVTKLPRRRRRGVDLSLTAARAALVGCALAAGQAAAADYPVPSIPLVNAPLPTIPLLNTPSSEGFIVTLGAQLQGSPGYVGSSKFSPGGSPIFAIRRVDEPEQFSAPDDNLQISLFGNRQYSVGFVGNVDFGRYRDGDKQLRGLNKVDWAPEAGAYGEYWPLVDRLRLRAEVRYGFGTDGFISELGGDWIQRYGAFTLSFGPRIYIGDSNYMMSYFGVTPQAARLNGDVRPYKIGGGLQAAGIQAALRYKFSPRWDVGVFGQYNRLGEEAARSPVTRKFGSADQIVFGVNFRYSFRVN